MTHEQAKHKIDLLDFYLQNYVNDYGEESHTAMMMAIKALEQQTCEDAISRQAVEKITWEEPSYTDALNVLTEVREKIRQLPSVNPQPKWIPVSERLPKEDNEVLITIKSCGKWYVCHSVYCDGQFWQKNFEYYSYRKPIAWMPLPKPYEPQEREDK